MIDEHAVAVRRRARRVWWLSLPQRQGFRSSVRLGVIAAYSITFMVGGFFTWTGWPDVVLWTVAVALWVLLLGSYVREVRGAERRGAFIVRNLQVPLLLVAPAFMLVVWLPVAAFVLVILAYVLELRRHSAGDGFAFSFGLVLFVGVFAALSMVEIEDDEPNSSLRTPSDALYWAFGSLLRINYGRSLNPETSDGRVLATVVGVCAVLAASLFTAQVISWVVGSRKDEKDEATTDDDLRAEVAGLREEIAALRSVLGGTAPDVHPGAAGPAAGASGRLE